MAYVRPNSTVQYFRGFYVTPDGEDTLYFPSVAAKNSFFENAAQVALTEEDVVYINGADHRQVIRSALSMSVLYNVRYLRFKNTSYENMWFYAFVTDVTYANNGMVEVTFVLDEIMTWMGVFTLGECLVLREHVASDTLYTHLVEEDLPLGDYVTRDEEIIYPHYPTDGQGGAAISDPVLVLSVAREAANVGSVGQYKGVLLSAAEYQKFDISPSGVTALDTAIDNLINATGGNAVNAIISAYIIPGALTPVAASTALEQLSPYIYNSSFTAGTGALGEALRGGSGDATDPIKYIPKNYKLYNYPYCVLNVYNGEGSEKEYRYEFFSTPSHRARFYWFGLCADVPEIILIPTQYRGITQGYAMDEAMMQRQFPQASVASDQFKAYTAMMNSGGGNIQVMGKIANLTINATGQILGGHFASAITGALTSGVDIATQLMADKQKYSTMPDSVIGTSNTNIMMAIGEKNFRLLHKSITAEYAKVIDEFFNAYGYRVNRVKVPSMQNRPRFTYVKTSGCLVKGALPSAAAAEIARKFDKGMRFWNGTRSGILGDMGNLNISNGRGGD